MNTLRMKIMGYDEASYSLLVSFSSDETEHADPESYPPLAFQPFTMWPDITDVNQIMQRIAEAGMYSARQQAELEARKKNTEGIAQLKALVGEAREFPVSQLLPPSNPEAWIDARKLELKSIVLSVLMDEGIVK